MWWECDDCCFASNSTKMAMEHIEETGHNCSSERDDDDEQA